MLSLDRRYRVLLRGISVSVICLFTFNTISSGLETGRQSVFNNINTSNLLQVQSMFRPILDVAGWEYDRQLRVEMACVLHMSRCGDFRSFQDINATIDEWIAGVRILCSRILNVIKNPEIREGKIFLEVALLSGERQGQKFRVVSSAEDHGGMWQNDGIVIEKISPGTGTLRDIGPWNQAPVLSPQCLDILMRRSRSQSFSLLGYDFQDERVETLIMTDKTDAPLPRGVYSAHFYDPEKERLVIVVGRYLYVYDNHRSTRSQVSVDASRETAGESGTPVTVRVQKNAYKEAVFHEWKEYEWRKKLQGGGMSSQQARSIAHKLASAESVIEFGCDGLTVFHEMQLESIAFDRDRLGALIEEDRGAYYELVESYLGRQARDTVEAYEDNLRGRMRRIYLDGEGDTYAPSEDVSGFLPHSGRLATVSTTLQRNSHLVERLRRIFGRDLSGKNILSISTRGGDDIISKIADTGAAITAAVNSNRTLQGLQEKLQRRGKELARARTMVVTADFPFENASFDAIVIPDALYPVFTNTTHETAMTDDEFDFFCASCQERRKKFFFECRRVLKPGGIIAGMDIELPRYPFPDPEQKKRAERFDREADVARLAEEEGFEVIERNRATGLLVLRKLEIEGQPDWRLPQAPHDGHDQGSGGRMGKFTKVEDVDLEKKQAVVKDLSTGRRFGLRLRDRGPVDLDRAIRDIVDKGMSGPEHAGLIRDMLNVLRRDPPSMYVFNGFVGDMCGFVFPGKRCLALHSLLEENEVALFHELVEYLIHSRMVMLVPEDSGINIISLAGETPELLGKVELNRREARTYLVDGAAPHYLIRAVQSKIFGARDRGLTEEIRMLKQDRESPGVKKVYHLGGRGACGRISRVLGSDTAWIRAGNYAYRIFMGPEKVCFQRHESVEGPALGRERRFDYHDFITVGRDDELRKIENTYVFADSGLSRSHFSFSARVDGDSNTRLSVYDMGSTNGTRVTLTDTETGREEVFPLEEDGLPDGSRPRNPEDTTASPRKDPDTKPATGMQAVTREELERRLMEKIKSGSSAAGAILRRVERVFNAITPDNSVARPVDIVVDLSLIPEKDLDANMETWAYLILMCARMRNVNFRFELPEISGDTESSRELLGDRDKAPLQGAAVLKLKESICAKAYIGADIGDIGSFLAERVNAPAREEAILIPVISRAHLEHLRASQQSLESDEYPVALDGATENASGVCVLRHFEAAVSLGLAKAALAMASQCDEETPETAEKEMPALKTALLNDVQSLFNVFRPDVVITAETLENMVHPEPVVRLNQAISLALPPVARMVLDNLRSIHENMHTLLMAA